MNKKLDTDQIANELLEGSVFFQRRPSGSDSPAAPDTEKGKHAASAPASEQASVPASALASSQASEAPRKRASQQARPQASKQASEPSSAVTSALAIDIGASPEAIWQVRGAVKAGVVEGRPIYVRVSPAAKARLNEIRKRFDEYHGYETTESEITRIALTAILTEYEQKGEDSLLVKVIRALRE